MELVDFAYSYTSIDYEFAICYMKEKVKAIIEGNANQTIWLLEHPSIYTAGRSASNTEIVKKIDVPYYYTDRGGKFTYHGPGQKVIYAMLDLNKIFKGQPDIKIFIKKLGIWIVNVLKQNGLVSKVDNENIGVWVENGKVRKKIVSIGIKLRKWVSYHGIAININPDMKFFDYIIPCGLSGYKMTSMTIEKGKLFSYKQIDKIIKEKFLKEFDCVLGKEYEITSYS